jgi:hypothetical protein
MLRPAVAVTNCVNAEETGAWDILLVSYCKGMGPAMYWPKQGQGARAGRGRQRGMENGGIAALRRDKGEAALTASAGAGYTNLCPVLT